MDTYKTEVGNTLEIAIDLGDGVTVEEPKIDIYTQYSFQDGFSNLVGTKTPAENNNGKILFSFDTDNIINKPGNLYLHFFAKANGKKVNHYFKIKFKY